MIKKILNIGNEILRQKSLKLTAEEILSPEISELKQDLLDTLNSQRVGVGISAVQIGILKSVFLVNIKSRPNRPDLQNYGPKYFFNTEILEFSKKEVKIYEACLSIVEAKLYGNISRPEKIKVKYLDEDSKEHVEEFEGFISRVIQHEVDHLNGKLFTDIVSPDTLISEEEYTKDRNKK